MENVVIVGNCQARPLANIISACSHVSVSNVFIVHLERPDQSERFWRSLDAADYILYQLTADNYPCAHVRSSEIKGRYPDKTLVWPNVFHSGQQPFLRYVTNLALGRIMGPMDAYHDIEIFNQWRKSRGLDGIVPLPDVKEVLDVSTRSLIARERECGVKIADFISENISTERLFSRSTIPLGSFWLNWPSDVAMHWGLILMMFLFRPTSHLGAFLLRRH